MAAVFFLLGALRMIHPQSCDVAMNMIVTEAGVSVRWTGIAFLPIQMGRWRRLVACNQATEATEGSESAIRV